MKIISILLISTFAIASNLEDQGVMPRHVDLLDAMCEVESNCDPTQIGNDGEIGWYQILPDFWADALEHDPSIGGEYKDVAKDKAYAEKVILAYWDRYATIKRLGRTPTNQDLARIHNGGPNGYKKNATVGYWNKVKARLYE
tara:strand:+ start:623 stop:1048 length:426 start_codon:yes stop_codon:yes gene_type:complete